MFVAVSLCVFRDWLVFVLTQGKFAAHIMVLTPNRLNLGGEKLVTNEKMHFLFSTSVLVGQLMFCQ